MISSVGRACMGSILIGTSNSSLNATPDSASPNNLSFAYSIASLQADTIDSYIDDECDAHKVNPVSDSSPDELTLVNWCPCSTLSRLELLARGLNPASDRTGCSLFLCPELELRGACPSSLDRSKQISGTLPV